jgi:hypothetical protein
MRVNKPYLYDETGLQINRQLGAIVHALNQDTAGVWRVQSLTEGQLIAQGTVLDVIGIPVYVSDVSDYSAYSLTDKGWYVFARISAEAGKGVKAGTTVTGAAGYIKSVGADHIDVAVKFEVAAQSKSVAITWDTDDSETFIFRAADLAIRNLDYRSTFYIYDIAEFAEWVYAQATGAFAGTTYYVLDNGEYVKAAVKARADVTAETYYVHSYALTEDETFQADKTYYTKSGDVYTEAEVTPGEAVTANTYYEDKYTLTTDTAFAGTPYYTKSGTTYTQAAVIGGNEIPAYYEDHYALTADETFQDGKTYYTKSGSTYTEATVTTGEAVTPDTYYEHSYVLTEDTTFQADKTYYTLSGTTYSEAEVNPGDAVPAYYTHSKLVFSGMVRNVTYKFDELVDVPVEIVLPEVPDDGYGCWFEIQTQFSGQFSVTLTPTDETVKIGTATTQGLTAGINVLDLTYADINGVKVWTLLNTHSNLPAAAAT